VGRDGRGEVWGREGAEVVGKEFVQRTCRLLEVIDKERSGEGWERIGEGRGLKWSARSLYNEPVVCFR